jgi:hypothetical protein
MATIPALSSRLDEPRYFLLTQNHRQSFGTFGIDQIDISVVDEAL